MSLSLSFTFFDVTDADVDAVVTVVDAVVVVAVLH